VAIEYENKGFSAQAEIVVDADSIRDLLAALSTAQSDPSVPTMELVRLYEPQSSTSLIVDVFPGRVVRTSKRGVEIVDRGTVGNYAERDVDGGVELGFRFTGDFGSYGVGPYCAGR